MINLKHNQEHIRIGASCYKCTSPCRLRYMIDSPDVVCCNYAAYGCIHYNGSEPTKDRRGGARLDRNPCLNKKIRKWMIHKKRFFASELKALNYSGQRIQNNLQVLKKKGVRIISKRTKDDVLYIILGD